MAICAGGGNNLPDEIVKREADLACAWVLSELNRIYIFESAASVNNSADFREKKQIFFLFLLRSWKIRPPLGHLCSLLELVRSSLSTPPRSWSFTSSQLELFALPAWGL